MVDVDGVGLDRKQKNTLPLYGNKETMNLNSMIRTNILGSPYFKEDLFQFKTFHEVVDEIYYKVEHVEPWEKNSRKLAGQVGMCAGVRGVAAGGIVSTPYCLLYKLFTLKLTRKQLTAMINHKDSPYIRALGFMYIRYCQPPADFWEWIGPYIDDTEEIDLKAGGGYTVTIGEMCRMILTKLEWFGTLFPRIPVNVQKELEEKLSVAQRAARKAVENNVEQELVVEDEWGEAGRKAREEGKGTKSPDRRRPDRSPRRPRDRSRERRRDDSRERGQRRERSRERRSRDRSRDRHRSHSRNRSRERRWHSRSYERRGRSRSRERRRSRSRERRRSRDRRERSRDRSRERSRRDRPRSRERRDRSRSREKRDRSRDRRGKS